MKTAQYILSLGAALLALPLSSVANINFTGGEGDLTFFYESQNGPGGTWHSVFRNKPGNTSATGLDNSFGGFTGQVGGGADFTFASLTVQMIGLQTFNVNGTDYFIFAANGSSIYDEVGPDLGIRTRLRENEETLFGAGATNANQFDFDPDGDIGFRMTLDMNASTFNGVSLDDPGNTAAFALFGWTEFGDLGEVRYETGAGDITNDWSSWGHTHWHWGFSEVGDYTLVFDIEGIGGTYGASASASQVAINFAVPEPSMAATIVGLVALLTVFGRRRN
ncbi:MAG: hypothetical protein EA353_05480 [Puniceicoccaceae bacterium]|nr:MAG: hypothetical protein EA353_05480 [Puniceicoccaceae bacterium]